jgi:hypothetical protein
MARKPKGRRRGPKTRWEKRKRYLKARDPKRLKQTQVTELMAATTFAAAQRTPLNAFLTVTFANSAIAFDTFKQSVARLCRLLRSHHLDLHWIYVWEAVGGPHIHALLHIPAGSRLLFEHIIGSAFAGQDTQLLARRWYHLTYMCKGADFNTFRRIKGNAGILCKRQGTICWKRCGTSLSLGRKARETAGFGLDVRRKNCAGTRTLKSHRRGQMRKAIDSQEHIGQRVTTYVEVQNLEDDGERCWSDLVPSGAVLHAFPLVQMNAFRAFVNFDAFMSSTPPRLGSYSRKLSQIDPLFWGSAIQTDIDKYEAGSCSAISAAQILDLLTQSKTSVLLHVKRGA